MLFARARRSSLGAIAVVLVFVVSGYPQTSTSDRDVIAFLNQAIQWYRQISSSQQLTSDAADVLYVDSLRQTSLEVLKNSFAFARAVAAVKPVAGTSTENAPENKDGENAPSVNVENLNRLANQAQAQVKQSQDDIEALQKELGGANAKKAPAIRAHIAETRSELELAQARSDTLNGFVQFLNSTASGAKGGLAAQIDELERTIPELRSTPVLPAAKKAAADAASSDAAKSSSTPRKQQSSGILGMIEEGFSLNAKLTAQKEAISATSSLRNAMQKLRAPLMQDLRAASQQGTALSAAPDVNDIDALQQRTKDITALTARFRQNSAAVVPLGKSLVLADAVRGTLSEWRDDTVSESRQELKRLLLRLSLLLVAIFAVFIASEIWRKATLRYVQDIRRRNQFMLLRRIVVSLAICLIVLFMLVTEVGSIATFAGFITAGLAVALQTVILSVVAYFLLIGKWGIRVGDRVSISGVTGDVIDIGLVRMHLMEVDTNAAEEQPTGRVVVFSNAVLFQPTANFFKQIPGTSFTWHRVTLTLAPESDYRHAEKLLMDAVNQVFSEYQDEIKRQHNYMVQTLNIPVKPPQPQSRFRFTESGLELVIRYPVPLERVSMIDDLVTRALVQALRSEPSLRLMPQGTPAIQPVPEIPHMDKPA